MSKNILKQFIVFPLTFFILMAPVLCCCFEGIADAGVESSMQQSQRDSSHCGSKTDEPSGHHDAQDCDCPHNLAESNLSTINAFGSFSGSTQKDFSPFLTKNITHYNNSQIVLATRVFNYPAHYQQDFPPIFILNHTFRI